MKIIQTKLDFVQFSPIEKVIFYRNVVDKFTGNPRFTAPDMSLSDASAAVDALEKAIIAASDGGHTRISEMHDQVKLTDTVFRNLAAYVDRIAAGDESTILSSGFVQIESKDFFIITPPSLQCQKRKPRDITIEKSGNIVCNLTKPDHASCLIQCYK